MRVPEHCLDRLRAAGLLVSDPYTPNHALCPDGVAIGKPADVPGNCLPGAQCLWGVSGRVVDSPVVWLCFAEGRWTVIVHTYVPGPGPGDFIDRWDTPEQATDDVLDYLLGDPARMRPKQLEWAAHQERLARLNAELGRGPGSAGGAA